MTDEASLSDFGGVNATAFPMFPLSGAVFPGQQLPLNVFEERYQRLVKDCRGADNRFGIVLIARGSEVGGGDQRFAVGTCVEIEVASPYAGGRWFLLVRGLRRLRVDAWRGEYPYPSADVEFLADTSWPDGASEVATVEASVRRCRELLFELGSELAPDAETDAVEPVDRLWQLCSMAPLNAMDAQTVLEIDEPSRRAEALTGLVDSLYEDLAHLRDD